MPPQGQSTRFLDHDILRSLENIELTARLLVEGMYASRHRCPYYGHTVEFKDYREYVSGDEPRLIDWKLLARTERYFVKRFEMESEMNVVCLLDTSGSMAYRPLDPKRLSKMEYASYLVASICYLAQRQQDSAGLVTFGEDMREFIPPKQGKKHLFGLLARLEAIEPQGETDFELVLKKVGMRLKRRSIVILVSDCLGDRVRVIDGIRHLAARGHEVIVLHMLDSDEVKFPFNALTSFRDMEVSTQLMCDPIRQRKKYMGRLEKFRTDIRSGSLGCGADYWFLSTDQPIEIILREYLMYRRQRG